jgi:hypothetical protein
MAGVCERATGLSGSTQAKNFPTKCVHINCLTKILHCVGVVIMFVYIHTYPFCVFCPVIYVRTLYFFYLLHKYDTVVKKPHPSGNTIPV